MASINDMAIKAYPKPELEDYYCNSSKVARNILCESAYKQGANDVLAEIENVVNNSINYKQIYNEIIAKIKELKGNSV